MNTAFIIAEYNPFHNGHRYHIRQTCTQAGVDCVVAVMSGNYVQRGDIALCDKFLRAEAAVRGGADLVLELPLKYAAANAGRFAAGAVQAIRVLGAEGVLSFGASAELEELRLAERLLTDPELAEEAQEVSRKLGKTYPSALSFVLLKKGYERTEQILKDPNNVLAVEYLKNIGESGSLLPLVVERSLSASHDAQSPCGELANAGYIRNKIYREYNIKSEKNNLHSVEKYVPEEAFLLIRKAAEEGRFPVDRDLFASASFSRLLTVPPERFAVLDNVNQGLENRIVQAIRDSSSVEEAIAAAKSKRFTMARLRQVMLAAVLGITKEDVCSAPSYLRVLAFNNTGRQFLATVRKTAVIPIATNLSDVSDDSVCRRDALLEYQADKLFDICLPKPRGGNRPFLDHCVYVKTSAV